MLLQCCFCAFMPQQTERHRMSCFTVTPAHADQRIWECFISFTVCFAIEVIMVVQYWQLRQLLDALHFVLTNSHVVCAQVLGHPACSQRTASPGLMTWTWLASPADPPFRASGAATNLKYRSRTGRQHCNPLAVIWPPMCIISPQGTISLMGSMRCIMI